jgi:hypothetical protein
MSRRLMRRWQGYNDQVSRRRVHKNDAKHAERRPYEKNKTEYA